MKKTIFAVAALLVFAFGCQSPHSSRWLTLPRSEGKILGQAPSSDDPFFNVFPAVSATSPSEFDPFAPVQQSAFGSDLAAEEAAKEAERQRIKTLATTVRSGAPDYLKPLNPWDGPFANRTRTKVLEQDIIRQAGYEQVNAKTFSSEPEYEWEKEEHKKEFDWSVLTPEKTYTRIRDWMGLGPDERKANESMNKGKEILLANPDLADKKKNLEAAKHFSEAAKRFPDSVLEEDALHLSGECYYFADDYFNAFTSYQKLVVKYHHSKYVDNAVRRIFKIGRYWEAVSEQKSSSFNVADKSLPSYDTFGFAKKAYETIFTYDPLGQVSDDALMALATAYLKRGRYQGDDNYNQAAHYYQRLREDHPTSKHIAKAHENELYARTQAYLGPEHPSRTLEEARKLADITLWQFNGELDSESKSSVLELKETILASEAERLWEMGQHWDLKKQCYGAARIHYNKLIAEYPQTAYAERAQRRLTQIEGLPDTPSIFRLPTNPFKKGE
ncbi:MAG: tetratricopeptide repeat protein [Planctomycetaceae bacterium]|nr:tetratricopeptide repeat protein [Planctomycetaceae bacterium]